MSMSYVFFGESRINGSNPFEPGIDPIVFPSQQPVVDKSAPWPGYGFQT
jgi:hypothetical protein